jgi:hypothetical protein
MRVDHLRIHLPRANPLINKRPVIASEARQSQHEALRLRAPLDHWDCFVALTRFAAHASQ